MSDKTGAFLSENFESIETPHKSRRLGMIMRQTVRLSVATWVAVLLSNVSGIAQRRYSGEIGRGAPYSSSSGGDWWSGSWSGVLTVLGVLVGLWIILSIFLAIAGGVKDRLENQHWVGTHILILAAATLAGALWSSAALFPPKAELFTVVLMLFPSFAAIGVLYIMMTGFVNMILKKLYRR